MFCLLVRAGGITAVDKFNFKFSSCAALAMNDAKGFGDGNKSRVNGCPMVTTPAAGEPVLALKPRIEAKEADSDRLLTVDGSDMFETMMYAILCSYQRRARKAGPE